MASCTKFPVGLAAAAAILVAPVTAILDAKDTMVDKSIALIANLSGTHIASNDRELVPPNSLR